MDSCVYEWYKYLWESFCYTLNILDYELCCLGRSGQIRLGSMSCCSTFPHPSHDKIPRHPSWRPPDRHAVQSYPPEIAVYLLQPAVTWAFPYMGIPLALHGMLLMKYTINLYKNRYLGWGLVWYSRSPPILWLFGSRVVLVRFDYQGGHNPPTPPIIFTHGHTSNCQFVLQWVINENRY